MGRYNGAIPHSRYILRHQIEKQGEGEGLACALELFHLAQPVALVRRQAFLRTIRRVVHAACGSTKCVHPTQRFCIVPKPLCRYSEPSCAQILLMWPSRAMALTSPEGSFKGMCLLLMLFSHRRPILVRAIVDRRWSSLYPCLIVEYVCAMRRASSRNWQCQTRTSTRRASHLVVVCSFYSR